MSEETQSSMVGALCALAVLGVASPTPSHADVVVFRQGSGYAGTVDTSLITAFPDTNFSAFAELDIATAAGPLSIVRQGLLRFENIFGPGPNQIPPSATIQRATLTLTKLFVSNSRDGFGHRMLIPWRDTDTWNSLVAGIQFDGTEAQAAVDFTLSGTAPNLQDQTVDVTQTLITWLADPARNFGWVLEGGPTDGSTLGFGSSDQPTASFRPTLEVEFTAPPQFACAGFEPPLASGAVTVKKNRVLPLKAQLLDQSGTSITDTGLISRPVAQILFESGVGPAVDVTAEALPAGKGTLGNRFEFVGGTHWQFNLSTMNYTAIGTYTIKMLSGNEAEYGVNSCIAHFVITE